MLKPEEIKIGTIVRMSDGWKKSQDNEDSPMWGGDYGYITGKIIGIILQEDCEPEISVFWEFLENCGSEFYPKDLTAVTSNSRELLKQYESKCYAEAGCQSIKIEYDGSIYSIDENEKIMTAAKVDTLINQIKEVKILGSQILQLNQQQKKVTKKTGKKITKKIIKK